MDENVLGRRTASAREWAFRQLRRFYGLDPNLLLFRALRDLWTDDPAGQPLLALLCAMARDPILRASATLVLGTDNGVVLTAKDFEKLIDESFPDAYRASTRRATAQKLSSSWHQSGHLHAESTTRKIRSKVTCLPSPVAYALLLGHLQGVRGLPLFDTVWAQALDQPPSRLLDLDVTASQRGHIEFRHAGGVVEVSFHGLLRPFADPVS